MEPQPEPPSIALLAQQISIVEIRTPPEITAASVRFSELAEKLETIIRMFNAATACWNSSRDQAQASRANQWYLKFERRVNTAERSGRTFVDAAKWVSGEMKEALRAIAKVDLARKFLEAVRNWEGRGDPLKKGLDEEGQKAQDVYLEYGVDRKDAPPMSPYTETIDQMAVGMTNKLEEMTRRSPLDLTKFSVKKP